MTCCFHFFFVDHFVLKEERQLGNTWGNVQGIRPSMSDSFEKIWDNQEIPGEIHYSDLTTLKKSQTYLGGGFKCSLFSPLFVEDFQFD